MSRNLEVWTDYDRQSIWTLHIRKKRGRLTLDEIREACMDHEQDFYLLVVCAMDQEIGQYYDTDDLDGDYVTLYRADDFFKWREKGELTDGTERLNRQDAGIVRCHDS